MKIPLRNFSAAGSIYVLKCLKSLVSNSFQAQKKPTVILSELRWTYGPSDRVRTCGLMVPNLLGILFSLVYSGFRRFLICFTYSLALLSPLFPDVPAPSVVIYVVKNASRPVSGEDSPVPDRKRFAFQIVCIVTLSRRLCKRFLQGCGSKVEPL